MPYVAVDAVAVEAEATLGSAAGTAASADVEVDAGKDEVEPAEAGVAGAVVGRGGRDLFRAAGVSVKWVEKRANMAVASSTANCLRANNSFLSKAALEGGRGPAGNSLAGRNKGSFSGNRSKHRDILSRGTADFSGGCKPGVANATAASNMGLKKSVDMKGNHFWGEREVEQTLF
jgi:hypothetical protein